MCIYLAPFSYTGSFPILTSLLRDTNTLRDGIWYFFLTQFIILDIKNSDWKFLGFYHSLSVEIWYEKWKVFVMKWQTSYKIWQNLQNFDF